MEMVNSFQELMENPERGNTRYVFPFEDNQNIAKMISALTTIGGGEIYFGIYDDGNKLIPKGYHFSPPNAEEIKNNLDGFSNFSIKEFKDNARKYVLISVGKTKSSIPFYGKYYNFIDDFDNNPVELFPVSIFLSYSWNEKKLIDRLQEFLEEYFGKRITIFRDTQLSYKDNLTDFMKKSSECDVVISLVSKSYLNSQNCMFEVTEFMKERDYESRLAPIVLKDQDEKYFEDDKNCIDWKPEVYGTSRFDYIVDWKKKYDEMKEKIKTVNSSPEISLSMVAESRKLRTIAEMVGDYMEYLNKILGQGFSEMEETDFLEIRKMVESSFSHKNHWL